MCLNRQVDSIRITLQRRNLHRIENGLVRFSVNRVSETKHEYLLGLRPGLLLIGIQKMVIDLKC